MLGQAVGGYTNATHGMTLSAVSLPYYRHILPYGLAKFKRFAVNVWDVAPEGKSDREVAEAGLAAMEACAGAGPGHETLRPGRNRGNAGMPGRWYRCAPRRLQASLSGRISSIFFGKAWHKHHRVRSRRERNFLSLRLLFSCNSDCFQFVYDFTLAKQVGFYYNIAVFICAERVSCAARIERNETNER